MAGDRDKSLSSIGFISVVDSPRHGLFGGYLVLSPAGRPLEFHCTEPVNPSRAQEILYGPTLESYLYGEQLGQALLGGSSKKPPVILTDTPPMLAAKEFVSVPIILIETDRHGDSRTETTVGKSNHSKEMAEVNNGVAQGGAYPLDVSADCPTALVSQIQSLGKQLDLTEPFDRIREAIEEAQRGSQRRSVA